MSATQTEDLMTKPYLTIRDVSDMLDVSVVTVQKWVQEKKVKCLKMGKVIRFKQSQITELFED